ncbi:DegV domain-containing protein SAV1425 [uncultured Clostridium sp.]|nr:DegV domain-containing protein SAV1425 [uncultured Clostridium sp.]SCJ28234.1 DegV domain-containing protein SAV1425 [uncultured Clostridium sp.]
MKTNMRVIIEGSTDFPKELLDKMGVKVVGINIAFGDENYIGGVDISEETFYEKMRGCKELPKTSSPSPEKFIEMFDCEEEEILIITLTSKLSSTYSSAVLAKNIYLEHNPGANKRIAVVDSLSGSIGVGLMVYKANKLIQEGKSLKEVTEYLENIKTDLAFYGVLNTLDNAIKGGRVNPIAGKLINALNFKVIIEISEGVVKPIDKARGESNSVKKLLEIVKNNVNDTTNKTLVIGHSNCEEKAYKIAKQIEENYEYKDIIISSIGPVMGTYTSEGAILIAVL